MAALWHPCHHGIRESFHIRRDVRALMEDSGLNQKHSVSVSEALWRACMIKFKFLFCASCS
jgi:hypothetical protein